MNDDDETITGGTVSWEEQENGTYSQIVVLRFKKREDLVNTVISGVTKKELFKHMLEGEDRWPLNQTSLTTGSY